jgi:hypothetical protein
MHRIRFTGYVDDRNLLEKLHYNYDLQRHDIINVHATANTSRLCLVLIHTTLKSYWRLKNERLHSAPNCGVFITCRSAPRFDI